MKRVRLAALTVAFSLLVPLTWAVEKPFETGTILNIARRERNRVLYYLVNTPITEDDPYYEVTVQLHNMIYVAEYTPVHASQVLPDDWQSQGTVEARVEKHYIFLKQPKEPELQLVIVRHASAVAAAAATTVKH